MLPPQLIRRDVNRSVQAEILKIRTQMIRQFQSVKSEAIRAKKAFDTAPSPISRDALLQVIGKLRGYQECRNALRNTLGSDNTLRDAVALIINLESLVQHSDKDDHET